MPRDLKNQLELPLPIGKDVISSTEALGLIALPPALYCMQGIMDALKEKDTEVTP